MPFKLEPCKRVPEQLAIHEGVMLLYFTSLVHADVVNGHIEGVFLHGKSGFSYVNAKSVVDVSCDAELDVELVQSWTSEHRAEISG